MPKAEGGPNLHNKGPTIETPTLTPAEARKLRFAAQGLSGPPATNAPDAARVSGAVQSQDRLGELLAVRVRSRGLTAEDSRHARLRDRTLVRTWLQRGTLHTVPSGDLRWLLNLLGAEMDAKALRRRADLGITPESHARSIEAIRCVLSERGPLTRRQIGDYLREHDLPHEGQTVPHLLRSVSLLGHVCFGPEVDGEVAHVLIDDWIAELGELPSNPSARLAETFYAAYGPATPADLRWWSGLPAAAARAAHQAIADQLVEVDIDGRAMWMLASAANQIAETLARPDTVRLLGPFDPYILGYAKRDLGVPEDQLKQVNAGGGMIRPTIIRDGVLIGTWQYRSTKTRITITIRPFADLSEAAQAAIKREIDDIARYLNRDARWSID